MLILSISQVHPFPTVWAHSLFLNYSPHFSSPRLQQPPKHFLVPVGIPGTNCSCSGQSNLSRHKPGRRSCHRSQVRAPRWVLGATWPPVQGRRHKARPPQLQVHDPRFHVALPRPGWPTPPLPPTRPEALCKEVSRLVWRLSGIPPAPPFYLLPSTHDI